jgi:hypothetical protein
MNVHWDFTGVTGFFVRDIPVGQRFVSATSYVVASVVEINKDLTEPFIGDANNMMVKNVCPKNNGNVQVTVETNWTGDPIDVRVTLIINPA